MAQPDIHPAHCDCGECEAYHPAERGLTIDRLARIALAGLALGAAATVALDRVLAGPGPLVVFGL